MRIALVLVSLALTIPASAKDLIIHQRSTAGDPGSTPRAETLYVAGGKVVNDSDRSRTIIDVGARTITTADKDHRTYTVVTFDGLRAQLDTLRKNVDSLPPEARKLMGDMLEEGPPVTVTPTGKTETIAGYPAKEYALSGGRYSGSIWATDAIETPPELAKWRALDKSAGASAGLGNQLGEALAKVKGLPLRTRLVTKLANQSVVITSEALQVKEESPPADVLRVPEGFTPARAQPGAD